VFFCVFLHQELRVEMAAKARDAEEIARVQKRVDAEVDQWVRAAFTASCVVQPAKDSCCSDVRPVKVAVRFLLVV
jgi:hypothetical protein